MAKIPDFKLGATGRFPEGKLGPEDEGELQLALMADHANGVVHIEFGKPVAWLGLPSGVAREFAAMLIEKANELDARKS